MRHMHLLFLAPLFLSVAPLGAESLPFEDPNGRLTMISKGQEFELDAWRVPGKVTVFDFYSDYCPPCKAFKGPVAATVRADESTALRVVDINREGKKGIDWDSPVARQYGLKSIPHFIIVDANGKIWARGEDAKDKLVAWMVRVGQWPPE